MAGVRSAARELASIGERHAPPDPPRHFLDIDQFDPTELRAILDAGLAYKNGRRERPLAGKILAMIFEKPSTRTRVSFEVAMRQLGGETIYLSTADSQLGRGETVADTARVLSRYVDAIMIRTNQPGKLDDLARYATVPGRKRRARWPARSWPGAATATMSPPAGFTRRFASASHCGSPARKS
jgi:hypothetical protein